MWNHTPGFNFHAEGSAASAPPHTALKSVQEDGDSGEGLGQGCHDK